jgi:ectoine hydroxylase
MIERQDPVIFTGHGETAPLSVAQSDAYERDGFLRLDGLFSEREIGVLIKERDRLRAIAADDASITVIAEPESRIVRSIFRVHTVSDVFGRLARDARLVNLARYLLGDEVYIHQSRLNYKPGFFGKEFYWHSDFETWHVEDGMPRMRALSVSISLTPNTPDNGPLMLIPGSHKRYVVCTGETPEEHFRQSLRKQEYGVPDHESLRSLVTTGGIETITGPEGTVAIFDCNTMHGSNGNITPYPRSNVFIVYNSVSNRVGAPFGPDKARPDFLAERSAFDAIQPLQGGIKTDPET